MNPILLPVITLLSGSLLTFYLSRKKHQAEICKMQAETQKTEIDSTIAVINMWKETALALQTQVKNLSEEVRQLKDEIQSLRNENNVLKHPVQVRPQTERSV